MQEYTKKIKAFLDKYRQEKYSGGIKMAFEEGRPQTFWRSDVPDFKFNPTDESFSLEKTLSMATNNNFSGSLFFILEGGEIKHYYSIETLQGRKLMERLDNCMGRNSKPKVIAIHTASAG